MLYPRYFKDPLEGFEVSCVFLWRGAWSGLSVFKNRQAFPCGKCCATWWIDPIPASVLPWMRSTKGNGRVQHIILLCPSEPPPPRREKTRENSWRCQQESCMDWRCRVFTACMRCNCHKHTWRSAGQKTTTWVVQDTAAAERRKWPLGTQNGSGFGLDVTVWWLSCTTFCQLKWRLNMLNRDLEIQTWSQSNYHCCWVASPSSTDLAVA